jgi:hypothetical protein
MASKIQSVMVVVLVAWGCVVASGCSQTPDGYMTYGANIKPQRATPAADVFADPDKYDGKSVKVVGTIDEVCAKRGCWLTVREGNEIMRARFVESGECSKGFYVPRDAGGRDAILQGIVRVEEIDQDTARHYLEDADAPQSEIDKIVGPQKALSMVCTGVAIADGATLSEPVRAE